MSQNMRYYLKVLANFIPIQILPAKVGRPMLNFGRPIVKCTPYLKNTEGVLTIQKYLFSHLFSADLDGPTRGLRASRPGCQRDVVFCKTPPR